MQGWFSKKKSSKGIVGVSERPDGVCIAKVRRRANESPRLTFCEFQHIGADSTLHALQNIVRRQRYSGFRAVGVLDPDAYSLLQIDLPDVPDAEIPEAVRWLIKDLLAFPHEEAVIDTFRVPTSHRERSRLGYTVAANHAHVQRYADLLQGARLGIEAIDIPEMSLHHLACELPESGHGVAFIYAGRRRTLITISRNGLLYLTRALTIGREQFLNVPGIETAPPETLPAALQELLNTIILEVQRSLDFYESQFAQAPVATIAVAPLEFPFPGLLPYFREHLGDRVRPFAFDDIFESPSLTQEQQAKCLLAAGAALRPEQTGS